MPVVPVDGIPVCGATQTKGKCFPFSLAPSSIYKYDFKMEKRINQRRRRKKRRVEEEEEKVTCIKTEGAFIRREIDKVQIKVNLQQHYGDSTRERAL